MELIEKYNISEEDVYKLSCIEKLKSESSIIQKEKLKSKSLGILKPYNIAFMDLGNLLNQVKNLNYHSDSKLISKYGEYSVESTKSEYMPSNLKSVLLVVVILIGAFFVMPYLPGGNDLKDEKVNSTLNRKWKGVNSANMGGYYIEQTIILNITGNAENGYEYTLSDRVWDQYSMRTTKDVNFSGTMNKEYTNWEGWLSSIKMNVDRKYWEFNNGGAKGNYGLLVSGDGNIVNNGKIELQLFSSDGTPTKFINLR